MKYKRTNSLLFAFFVIIFFFSVLKASDAYIVYWIVCLVKLLLKWSFSPCRVKRHKDDCLCAICVMMRRRQEREESAQIEDHLQTSSSHVAQEMKPEVY